MSGKLPKPELKVPELRIVLVGKTGVGKTSVMNTLLGRPAVTEQSASSQTTECRRETVEFGGQKLVVIDTPGVLNTRKTKEEVKKDIMEYFTYVAPGPHVFLLVLKPERFTKYDEAVVDIIQKIFGEESKKYTIALFTNRDKYEITNEDRKKIRSLDFIARHHCFENTDKNDMEQVPELLKKINAMVEDNNGQHYTSDMLKKAQEAIEKMKKETNPESEHDVTFLNLVVGLGLESIMGKENADLCLKKIDSVFEAIARRL
ncbi:GTPase IMAP family member 9-like [Centropristis striata]|uniref:GTPase IMAP family member 9-like n=1 Tax=Centropristis striata TaxID=184440 RepID=UPI0027DF2F85|nr:GTPase IMAP family member 9-like [Centropristis striata]